jgi:hypothetical protein
MGKSIWRVVLITVADNDSDTLFYLISGTGANSFSINSSSGVIMNIHT